MRSKSPSPIHSQAPGQSKRFYSREEVSQLLRSMFENKLTYIYQELQEKQQIIRLLNEKMNRNDANMEVISKKLYEYEQEKSQSVDTQARQISMTVCREIQQKIQQCWAVVQSELDHIRTNMLDSCRNFHNEMRNRVQKTLTQIRVTSEEGVEAFKKKNNTYWVKVKEALSKINSRTTQCEQKIGIIGVQINKYESQREEHTKIARELQNGVSTAKMLLELKKSVNNVYNNFEEVLKLQRKVKQHYNQMSSLENLAVLSNQSLANKPQWNYAKLGRADQTKEDLIILEYSVEQDTLSHKANKNSLLQRDFSLLPQNMTTCLRSNNGNQNNQFGKKQNQQNETSPLSPLQGRIVQNVHNSSLDIQLNLQRIKRNHPPVTSSSTKNETNEWPDHEYCLAPHNISNELNRNDRSDSFQLNLHNNSHNSQLVGLNNKNSRIRISNNPSASSMLNFSLQCRRETVQDIRPRILQMIEAKGLHKPIRAFMDQINYLKNQQGNYLFDLKGNMFKLSQNEFLQLQKDGILSKINEGTPKKAKR